MCLHIYSKNVLLNHWKGELASFRIKVCNTECELLICSDIKKKKAGQQTPYGNSWAESSFLNIHWIFFPSVISPFFFHIRGFSLALPSSKSHRESAAPSTYPALQSRGISNISVIPIKHCMAKYTWWLQNFSMWPGNFNTTASAGSSKRHSLLCFFQRKKGFVAHSRAFPPPVFTPPSQYHTHLIQQKQMRCEPLQRWMPAIRGAVLQLCCPTTKTLCRKGVDAGSISDRVIWSNSNKKKGALFLSFMFLFATSSQPLSCMAFM